MRVLIVGEGKSGTTALMRSVAACLDNPVEIFEPKKLLDAHADETSVVVKKLLLDWTLPEAKIAERFDKRILIERDPRDRLISHLLYDAYNRGPFIDAVGRLLWLETLEAKVADPSSVPFSRLIHQWWTVSNTDLFTSYVRACTRITAFMRNSGKDFHAISYEDYVAGNFGQIDAYLNLTLEAGIVLDSESRVARSKGSGAWRHWFTSDDAELFQPMTDRVLRLTGRDNQDWALEDNPAISHQTSVGYVEALFEKRPFEPEKPQNRKNKFAAKLRGRP